MKRLLAVLLLVLGVSVAAPVAPAAASYVTCETILKWDPRVTMANGSVRCINGGYTSVSWSYPQGIRMGEWRSLTIWYYTWCGEYSCSPEYSKGILFPGTFYSASLSSYYWIVGITIAYSG